MTASAVPAGFLVREALISAFINAAIGAGFFLLAFGFGSAAEVWGVGNYVFDFIPQGFAVAFFAALVPSLLALRAVGSGKLPLVGARPSAASRLGQAIAIGLLSALAAGLAWGGVFWIAGSTTIAAETAFALKVAFGFLLGGAITFKTLQRMLLGNGSAS